jgi:hypothetical protein
VSVAWGSDRQGNLDAEKGDRIEMSWIYEARLYDSKAVASYVAMCVRDDHLLQGWKPAKVQVFRTRKGNYGIRYRHPGFL